MRLNRVVAYVLRFIKVCRKQPVRGPISAVELNSALNLIIKISQDESFPEYKLIIKTYLVRALFLNTMFFLMQINCFA